jgi:hypothetical protein
VYELIMKKLIVTILATLYLTASVGAPISIHYCMGKLVDWSMSNNEASNCAKCGMEKKATADSGCCSDEAKFIKNTGDQATAATMQFQVFHAADVPLAFAEYNKFPLSSLTLEYTRANAPPILPHVPIHVRNCMFLI